MTRDARGEGLSRRHRFTARGSFGELLRAGKKVRGPSLVVHAAPSRTPDSRLGIALTRRLVASSVDRNRVKRAVRETFRRHPVKRDGLDCVVTLRIRFAGGPLAALRSELGGLFDHLHEARMR